MSLENWLRSDWLTHDESSVAEIQKLLQVVDRERQDAGVAGLSPDGKFEHAYDAALQLCLLALRAAGYRVKKGGGHHVRGIESLRFTLGSQWKETADYLSRCNHLRGQVVYDHVGVVSSEDASELVDMVDELRNDVVNWLRVHHPRLVPADV